MNVSFLNTYEPYTTYNTFSPFSPSNVLPTYAPTYAPPVNYHMITDNVAVGNYLSSYEPFDVIVNMCFPQNGVTHRQIDIQQSMNNGRVKLLIRIGVNDDPSEDMGSLLSKLIPYLVALRRQYPAITILFHCFAGISRSSTAAIAYLMAVENISLQEAYQMVKNKRPIIQPNEGFIKALLSYKKDDYVVRI